MVAWPLPVLTPETVGASGTVREVIVTVPAGELPAPFTATIENVVATPFVNPLTEIGLEVAVNVSPVELLVAMYDVIGDPLLAGAVNEIEASPSVGAARIEVGTPGTLIGVTVALAFDGADCPTAFTATAVKK